MGDVLVSALVKEIIGRLSSLAIQEFGLHWGFKKNISSLKKAYLQVEAVIKDAEEKTMKGNAAGLWLRDLRLASLEVENVLDEIPTEALLRRLHKEIGIERGIKYKVRSFVSKVKFRVRIAHKVKAMKTKLDDIASNRHELGLIPNVVSDVDVDLTCEMPSRETSSFIHDSSSIFGREEEMEMVTEKICNNGIGKYENGEILVYGIWGMGGIGKTTLAQLVYNHERVKKDFELRCWVYVSEKFQIKEIIKGIIESVDPSGCTFTHLDVLQKDVQEKLKGKKFLIVLDDVWIEEKEMDKWGDLSKTLSCGTAGSIVVMTTRSQTTSRMMARVGELQHELGCLSKEESWLLFKKHAFAQGRKGDDISELEPIGRKIVENCNGLPLAVKTIGGLMWSKRSVREWEHVKGNIVWNFKQSKVLPALKLSYDNLLPHLKRCFAYCCLFPKGYELEKNVLIPLWLSNGFIPPKGEISRYYIGEEIFNCLVWRSFFQVVKDQKYRMHDLMHDMARHVMGDDCVVIEPGKEVNIPNEVLYLTSSCPDLPFSPEISYTSLRSVLMFGEIGTCISQIFNHMYIRVLYLTCIRLRILPTSICKLRHLRYLNLSQTSIEVLPESIVYLQNLQVLLLSSCKELCKLPERLGYMTKLHHLDISECPSLLCLPSGIKKLTSLQMLPSFPLHNSGAKIGELGDLNLLEGQLRIEGLQNVGSLSEAESANLKSKTNLLVLTLQWSGRKVSLAYNEEVIKGLEPNSCLKELAICGYMGKTISPSWMLKLNNLVKITLLDCKNCLCIPALGRLPNVRVINMRRMKSLKCFHGDDDNMLADTTEVFLSLQELYIFKSSSLVSLQCNLPKLEVLEIRGCDELVSLPGDLPKLKILIVGSCEKLISLPCNLPKLEHLEIVNCNELVSLPGDLPKLKVLWITDCCELVSVSANLPALENLEIELCNELVSLPGNLPELKFLSVIHCCKLVSMSPNLPTLEYLYISYCIKLVSLPGYLPNLKILSIEYCEELVCLPGNLPNIRTMGLEGCDKLLSLPDEIQSFKDLDHLLITDCKHLFERYDERNGEDWHKVSHIRFIKNARLR